MAAHLRRDSLPPPFLMSNYEEFWDGGNLLPNYVTARPGIKIRTINAVAANPRAALAIILVLVAATVGLSVGLGITLGLEGSTHTTGWLVKVIF